MKRGKKNPLEITISSFVLACFRVKEMPIQKVPGAKQILSHQLLGCVSKARPASRIEGPGERRQCAEASPRALLSTDQGGSVPTAHPSLEQPCPLQPQ